MEERGLLLERSFGDYRADQKDYAVAVFSHRAFVLNMPRTNLVDKPYVEHVSAEITRD